MNKVLVTGATGFVGGHLVDRLLKEGKDVRLLVRDSRKITGDILDQVDCIQGDILDKDSVKQAVDGVDTVFHVAAVLGPSYLSIDHYRAVNAESVRILIDACQMVQDSIRRVVFVSTVGVLGPLRDHETACEGTPPKPENKYEITKLEGELVALDAAKNGFPIVIARPAWVYGPRDTRTLKLFRMIARKRFFVVGPARNRQHPIWIGDLIDGLIRCAVTPGIEGRVYHLAGPDILSVKALCEHIANAVSVSLPAFSIPMWGVLIPAYLIEWLYSLWGGEPPVDHRKVDFFRVNRAYSIERARTELGWEPSVHFPDGIAQSIAWYREAGEL